MKVYRSWRHKYSYDKRGRIYFFKHLPLRYQLEDRHEQRYGRRNKEKYLNFRWFVLKKVFNPGD